MIEKMAGSQKKRRWIFLAVVLLQVLFLCGLAASYYAIDVFGEEIVLETAPVDPRDLFYGDYVILNYEISRIDRSHIIGDIEEAAGSTIYVVLQPAQGGVYALKQAYLKQIPDTEPGEVVLHGLVDYAFGDQVHVKYGLERYYVPEGTGREIEDLREGMKVKVHLAPWGKAKVSELILPQ